MSITNIEAAYDMVKISSTENGSQLVSQDEALLRAAAIMGIDEASEELTASLIQAVQQARVNAGDKPYTRQELTNILKGVQLQGKLG